MRSVRLLSGAALAVCLAAPAHAAAAKPRVAAKPAAAAPAPAAPAATAAVDAAPAAAGDASTAADVASAPPPAVRPLKESVAAVINDEIISTYDLRQRVRLLIVSTGVQPTEQNLPQIEREALRALVDERLQGQELKRVEDKQHAHVFPSEKEIDGQIAEFAHQFNVSPPQLIKTLEGAGIEPATLRNQLKVQLGWQRYMSGRFHDNVRVGDDQVTAMMARINAASAKPQYLVSEVFIDDARAGGREQALQGADQLVTQMKQGAPFAAVARQFSALPTAANGGDAGWLVSGEIQPELEHALEALQPGQTSAPVPVRDGVYLLQLREKRSGAGTIMVDLKQAAIPLGKDAAPADVAAAQAKLESLRAQVRRCDQLAPEAAKMGGVQAGDLGETSLEELNGDFRKAIDGLKPGEVSAPVRTSQGLHLVEVCGRRIGGAKEPTRAEVENRIYGEQLSMIARRFLRDLRNSAAIENR